jgi:selenium metabolism protein YedF
METSNDSVLVDARGKACPTPVIMTKKAVDSSPNQIVTVIVDNDVAKENVSKFATSINYSVAVENKEGLYYLTLTPPAGGSEQASTEIETGLLQCESVPENQSYVVVITTDALGQGDQALGKLLMKNYIYAVKVLDNKPLAMLFLNRGVMLTTKGSELINDLKELENTGVEIISCGTCLDYYQLKDKVLVGSIGNMYTIADKMSKNRAIVL